VQSPSKRVGGKKIFSLHIFSHVWANYSPKPSKEGIEKTMMIMDRIALALAIIGGLNWGCVGLFRFDVVAYLFGGQTATVSRVIYTLVGLAAIWCVSLLFRSEPDTIED
jgi:hypothetical protein